MAETTAQIRARADAATPGPWHVHLTAETYVDRPSRYPIYSEVRGVVDVTEGDTYVAQTKRGNEQARADAEFIAHAREDVGWLLARVVALEAAVQASLFANRCPLCGYLPHADDCPLRDGYDLDRLVANHQDIKRETEEWLRKKLEAL